MNGGGPARHRSHGLLYHRHALTQVVYGDVLVETRTGRRDRLERVDVTVRTYDLRAKGCVPAGVRADVDDDVAIAQDRPDDTCRLWLIFESVIDRPVDRIRADMEETAVRRGCHLVRDRPVIGAQRLADREAEPRRRVSLDKGQQRRRQKS